MIRRNGWRARVEAGRDAGSEILAGLYTLATGLVGVVTFLGAWIYAIITYGYLFGVGLGWLPALIVAGIAAVLWPFAVVLGLALYFEYR